MSAAIQSLAERILQGQLKCADATGGRLPSERELVRQYGVGRKSVRKALALLEEDDLIYRLDRGGTFLRAGRTAPTSEAGSVRRPECITFLEGRAPQQRSDATRFIHQDHYAGYTDALERHHIKTRVAICPPEERNYASLLWQRVPFASQACVLVSIREEPLLRWLRQEGIPFVLHCWFHYDASRLPPHHRVYVNKTGGAYDAVRHLIELGHRRIGFIGGLPGDRNPIPEYEGYASAMRCAGLDIHPSCLLSLSTDDPHAALPPVADYLKQPHRPTAVFTRNDAMAWAVLDAARGLGISVPRELSVVGMNDQEGSDQTDPPLTTVSIPRRQLAATAVEILLDVIASPPDNCVSRVMDCRLVVRQTTAPPGEGRR